MRDWTGGTQPVIRIRMSSLDPRFNKYQTGVMHPFDGSTQVQICYGQRVLFGVQCGKYLLWSDIPNNRQLRWLQDDGEVTEFRKPSGNSNGNTFDHQGRQISCEHGNQRVVRYELDGSVTVLTDSYAGKKYNAPNDVVVHPNGSIWFTDPGYGSLMNYEGIV